MAEHPFRAAWRTRDLDAWASEFADDIVLHSPIVRAPFTGREAATELFGVLFDALGDFEITHELAHERSHAFFWRAEAAGRRIEGADLMRLDDDGKICEVRVLIRPLVDIAAFAVAVGPPLAAKRGRARGPLVRAMTLPLRGLLIVVDTVATRLVQRR